MPALDQKAFDLWRDGDAEFKKQLLDHMKTQTELNLRVENRLTVVEETHRSYVRRTTWVSSTISAIIAAIVGGIAGWGVK